MLLLVHSGCSTWPFCKPLRAHAAVMWAACSAHSSAACCPDLTFPGCRSLANNHLNGTLPAAWSSMGHLLSLDLSGNELTGPLPAPWARQRWLVRLGLGRNNFSGGLPREWSSFTSLLTLDLGGNNLTGRQGCRCLVWMGGCWPHVGRVLAPGATALPACNETIALPAPSCCSTQPAERVERAAGGHGH